MRLKLVILCGVVLVLIGAATGVVLFVDNMVKKRTTLHTFEVNEVPRFLTEETAIAFGRKALTEDGFDVAAWEVSEDGRTIDPDGRTDKYTARNSLNPNRVSMLFQNKADGRIRCFDVELEGKQVVCAVTIPK